MTIYYIGEEPENNLLARPILDLFEQPEYKPNEEHVAYEIPTSGLAKKLYDEISCVEGFAPREAESEQKARVPVQKTEIQKQFIRKIIEG
jgi:hypothetical protein